MFSRRIRAFAVLLVLAALPCTGVAAPGPARPAAKPAAPPAPVPSGMRVPLRAPVMADTVLATVYGAKDVTLSGFRKGCRKLGVDPARLTPLERRQVLDVLVDQSILSNRVAREPRAWTAKDSADYMALRDKLMLTSALNAALYQLAGPYMERGDSVPDMMTLGMMARDTAMKSLNPRWDDWSVRHLAAAFAALPKVGPDMNAMQKIQAAGMLPSVPPADTVRTILWYGADSMSVGRVLREYAKISPLYRPRIEDENGIQQMVGNIVFNDQLRRMAEAQHLDQTRGNAAQLAERAEYLDVQRFVQKNVYAGLSFDSAQVRRHWTKNAKRFRSAAKAEVVRMVFDTRDDAARWAAELAIPGRAESLATQSVRADVPYTATLNESADSALFKRVRKQGLGAILGPDSTHQGWRVMKVMKLELDQPLSYEDAYESVWRELYENEGERRMRALVDELRRHTVVFVNEKSPWLGLLRQRNR
ncbi:MAG: peptidylprolyl isomerase [Candidatus Eisenbacteria bacterium]